MNNVVWFMSGAISFIIVLFIFVLIEEWIEECGRKKLDKIVEEYENKLELQKGECEERLGQQREDLHEHTRKCLAEQKEQIEESERKAREYQSARFEEERVRLANENFDSGREQGKKDMVEKFKAMVDAGEITINRKDR